MYGMDPHDEIAYWRSRAQKAELELRSYRETEGTNAVCFDKVVAERDALRADCERMRRDYLTVADAVAAESTGPDDLATKARAARAELERLNKYIATHDEEYATMKETLRAEHQECQRLRADVAAIKERRAADLSAEDVEALRWLRDWLPPHLDISQDIYSDCEHCDVARRTLSVLDRIINGGGR